MQTLRPTLALIAAITALAAVPALATAEQDLRSPDARDPVIAQQDLRSPDARDAAADRLPGGSGVGPVPAPQPVAATPQAFDWRAAAIGAGVTVSLVLLATSVALLVRRRTPAQVA
jgi:hypothetical protein